jgi:superoxide dismutase, Fe-Mn family
MSTESEETLIMHTLPKLNYPNDALEPWLSRETLDYHHGRHHAAYIDKLNALIKGTEFEALSLEALVRHSAGLSDAPGALFNNAAQAWNHDFYWQCLTAEKSVPARELADALTGRFGSVEGFRQQFSRAALENFGSGWTWLVMTPQDTLEIVSTGNAGCPLTDGRTPLLSCDIWEHAYYIDYRNARADYIQGFWKIVNWDFVEAGLRRNSRSRNAA